MNRRGAGEHGREQSGPGGRAQRGHPAVAAGARGLCGLLPAQGVLVVDELERRGLVARQRSEADRRRSVVTLTAAGIETLARADELGERLVAELDPAARQAAIDALS